MSLEPLHIPDLLRRYHLKPQKSLGQNFLADHNALEKIVRNAEVSPEEDVLEIGAGLGSLTRVLAVNARSVVAVEIDANLFPALQAITRPFENVRLIHGDIMNIAPESLFSDAYCVVANIPYYITSGVIRHLLEAAVKPDRIVLTMQREVAERILNQDEKMSLLSLSVQVYGQARIAAHIPAACFYPQPKVDSSVLIIDVYDQPRLSDEGISRLFMVAHSAFNQKRKMLRSSLRPLFDGDAEAVARVLEQAGIDPTSRPEVLQLEDWIRLTDVISEANFH